MYNEQNFKQVKIMKTWTKFIFIPFAAYLLINTLVFMFGYTPSKVFSIMTLFALLSMLFLISIPQYLMLRLAPKAPYISTLSYVFILGGLISLARSYLLNHNFNQLDLSIFVVLLFSTLLTMGFYFFFQDPRFKVRYRLNRI
jgi:hypothetical protein